MADQEDDRKPHLLEGSTDGVLGKFLVVQERERKPEIVPAAASSLIARLEEFLPTMRAANAGMVKEGLKVVQSEPVEEGRKRMRLGDEKDAEETTIVVGNVEEDEQHVEMKLFVDKSCGELVADADEVRRHAMNIPPRETLRRRLVEEVHLGRNQEQRNAVANGDGDSQSNEGSEDEGDAGSNQH